MYSAEYVDNLIKTEKEKGTDLQEIAWKAALACKGWPYLFGARGSKTTKDGVSVRQFDCRGFTYWILLQVYGWKLMGAGCTTQWNNADNWKSKGKISDGFPKDTLVCLFYSKDGKEKTWEHTGFGLNNETVECSVGVQYFANRKSKWTHWGVPVCIGGEVIPAPVPVSKPILKNGSKGEYVTLCQTMLLNRGYSLPKYGADGSFGNETKTAVMDFQRDNNLTVDGIVGSATWAALENNTEPAKQYTVTIPHLTKSQAEWLVATYPKAELSIE